MTTLAPAASADVPTPDPGLDTPPAPAGDAVDPGTDALDLDEADTPGPDTFVSPTGLTPEQFAAMFGEGKTPGPPVTGGPDGTVPDTGPAAEDPGTDPADLPAEEPTSDATAPTSDAIVPPAAATELAAAQPVLADAAQPTPEVAAATAAASTAAASTAAASTPTPTASLAYTGANAGELTWAGLGLLAAGGAVTAGATRRRRGQQAG